MSDSSCEWLQDMAEHEMSQMRPLSKQPTGKFLQGDSLNFFERPALTLQAFERC